MSETNREFGSDIGNIMTASQSDDSVVEVNLDNYLKNPAANDTHSMDKGSNGTSKKSFNILSSVLAVEIFSLIQNNNSDQDDLLDEIEDLLDETFFVGEKVYHNTKEYTIKSKEKRGGLVQYTMETGQKINQRDLKRNKELNMEYFKNLLLESAKYDGKTWKVNEDIRNMYKLKEKLAPIFCVQAKSKKPQNGARNGSAGGGSSSTGSNSNSEDEKRRSESPELVFQARASGGMPAVANRRSLAEKQKKANEKKKLQDAKEKERAEKKKKLEEEKAKVKEEKLKQAADKKAEIDKEKAKKGLDKFLKKKEGDDDAHTPSMFSPLKFSEKRLQSGLKKLEDAWVKRDLEQFNEACAWCEKQLSGVQNKSIQNPIWNFSIQKLIDKNKDKVAMKGMKADKKQEYRQEMAESRKELYKTMEAKIKEHFSEEASEEDLLLSSDRLELPGSVVEDSSKESLVCMEIAQFFVSMRKILCFDHDISAKRLLASLKKGGPEEFKNCVLKMYRTLIETFLQEEEYDKIAHANARLHEFAVTELTITEIMRAFFVGKTELSSKVKRSKTRTAVENEEHDEGEEENEEMEVQENEVDPNAKPKYEEVEMTQEKLDSLAEVGNIQAADRTRFLAMFEDGQHMSSWKMEKHLELLQYLINLAIHLPIIREWYVKDVTNDYIVSLREKIAKITKEIEVLNKDLAELPPPAENIENLSRNESRIHAENEKKREKLEVQLENLKLERDDLNIKAAVERDDMARAMRAILIGEDRHLRRYYWFANNSDAGIWVQDFGTTAYEKWVRKCESLGIRKIEDEDPATLPEFIDEKIDESKEKWIRITDEECLKNLEKMLKKNGKREKVLKRYLRMNMDIIVRSFKKARASTPAPAEEDESKEEEEIVAENEFDGPFGSIKSVMNTLVTQLAVNPYTKMKNDQEFKAKLAEADDLEKMKGVFIDLVQSIPPKSIIQRVQMKIALTTREFSVLMVPRFINRIKEAVSVSALHLLISYLESRIDWKDSILEKMCATCRKKSGVERKLQCQNCETVYHYNCVRPTISQEDFELEGFAYSWMCTRCHNEEKRLKREAERESSEEKEERGSDDSDSESDEEYIDRSRKAKRKATDAMREAFEHHEAPQQKKPKQSLKGRKNKERKILPEVQALFDSIEETAPRFYKVLQNVPAPKEKRGDKQVLDLQMIEERLEKYRSPERLREELTSFFEMVRNYLETHNNRKLEELDELISALDF